MSLVHLPTVNPFPSLPSLYIHKLFLAKPSENELQTLNFTLKYFNSMHLLKTRTFPYKTGTQLYHTQEIQQYDIHKNIVHIQILPMVPIISVKAFYHTGSYIKFTSESQSVCVCVHVCVTWTFQKYLGFLQCPSISICLIPPNYQIQVKHFCRKLYR